MKTMYPVKLASLGKSDIEILEKELLNAEITWGDSLHSLLEPHRRRRADDQIPNFDLHTNESTNGTSHATGHHGAHHEHSLEEKIAHGLHKASISILGILVIEVVTSLSYPYCCCLVHRVCPCIGRSGAFSFSPVRLSVCSSVRLSVCLSSKTFTFAIAFEW